ncbi:MAG TPA: anthranilate synthase component I family protein [Nitrospirae bacterium]|nr:anthranilate synthase component I family protein [Nitrospirota bacterium]
MLKVLPTKKNFTENAKQGKIFPVYAELPYMPPQKVYESIKGPYSFLLESIKGPDKISRFSFAGADPFLTFKVKNGAVEIESRGKKIVSVTKSPLKDLKSLLDSYKMEIPEDFPPFPGGAVGLFSYDFVHYFERLPRTAVDDLQIPDAHFLLVDTLVAFDHKLKKTFIISCPAAGKTGHTSAIMKKDCGSYYEASREKINLLYEKIAAGNVTVTADPKKNRRIKVRHETGMNDYINIVKRTKEYIKAGDIFQANLSQRVSADIRGTDEWEIYKILSKINPSPFAAYLDMGEYRIVSSSPERLVKFKNNIVSTRPIAGTRPRGANAMADREMRSDLLINEKERAEHLMLIDLERNDLGKISDYGSVEVDELMITEDYSHVIHIVSNITGRAAKGKNSFDAVRAAFPGGTITGVPKVRCMEIIDELEPVTRGPYTGSLGYIGFTESMDLNIIIRTFVIKNGIAYVQAGAGIVADSEPVREYHETLKKAEALIKTLEML